MLTVVALGLFDTLDHQERRDDAEPDAEEDPKGRIAAHPQYKKVKECMQCYRKDNSTDRGPPPHRRRLGIRERD